MPTILTHTLIPIVMAKTITDRKMSKRFWLLAIFCSIAPDMDVIGFSLGIEYASFWGHRGFFHSLLFAFILSFLITLLAFRKTSLFSKKWWLICSFFFAVSASHGLLDAFTNGGLGIALFSPFDTTRYFFPWTPIWASPFGIMVLFSFWGYKILVSEIMWVWLPLTIVLLVTKIYRKIKTRYLERPAK